MFHFYRDCFFTMKDVKSMSQLIQALNKSLESGVLICQLYNGELNKPIMNLTNQFCQKQLELLRAATWLKSMGKCAALR